jgi:hypothetical protein
VVASAQQVNQLVADVSHFVERAADPLKLILVLLGERLLKAASFGEMSVLDMIVDDLTT